jgi:hypothetical protein
MIACFFNAGVVPTESAVRTWKSNFSKRHCSMAEENRSKAAQ